MIDALKHDAPIPLHLQAEQVLRQLIQKTPYRDGELLPDEMSLATQWSVSRGTVRTAIMKLVSEGLIERRAGVGTRVVAQPATSAMGAWRSLTREMAAKGITVESFGIDITQEPADDQVAQALGVKEGTLVWCLDRLRGWEGEPVLHSRSWFHPRLNLKGDEDFSKPLYETIEQAAGVVAEHAREALLAVPATRPMARKLKVRQGSPLMLRRHVSMDAAHKPFEFAEVHYVSERYTLTIDLQRGDR